MSRAETEAAPIAVTVPEDVHAGSNGVVMTHLAAGTYLVRAPADYDPEQITGMDLCCDPALTIVGFRPGRPRRLPSNRRTYGGGEGTSASPAR